MCKRFIFLLSGILSISCNEQVTVSDAADLGLRFRVKEMKEEFYSTRNSFDSIVPDRLMYFRTYKFDYRCRFTEIDFTNNMFPVSEADSSGYDRPVNDSTKCERDTLYIADESFVSEKYIYDNSGRSFTVYTFDKCKKLLYYEKFFYDNNLLSESYGYTDDETLISKTIYLYDKRKRLINKTVYYKSDYYATVFRYAGGVKTESNNRNFDTFEYRFDIAGKLKRMKKYSGKIPVSEIFRKYNSKGDIISETENDLISDVVKKTVFDYEYDAAGNRIKRLERRADGNVFLIKRIITYYE